MCKCVAFICGIALLLPTTFLHAQHEQHGESAMSHAAHDMLFDRSGMVMNANSTVLPRDCTQISEDVEFVVRAGSDYALSESGRVFGYSQYEFHAAPCSRVTVTFVNEDQVRHQWMLHGLPRYLYPQGMFHLEASGGETVRGSFILPKDAATYLVHCDITQHMEKGMKAQLLVGGGDGDLWSIPSVSADFNSAEKGPDGMQYLLLILGLLAGTAIGTAAARAGLFQRSA